MALINLRNALMAGRRLPYDAELEYLESTGTQWIVSDISFTSGHIVITGGAYSTFTESTNSVVRYFVGQSSSERLTNDGIGIAFYWAQTLATYYCTWGNIHGASISLNNPYFLYDLNTTTGTIYREFGNYSGTLTDDRLKGTANDKPLVFFAKGADGTGAYPARIYYLKIEIDGVLVRDFIPVRVGTVGYMYDRVTRKLFGNAGTGDFVLGPDVVPVEYIESHGTEWIDTGMLPTDDSEFFITLNIPSGTTANYLMLGSVNEGKASGNYAAWMRTYSGGTTYSAWGLGNANGTTTTYPVGFVEFGFKKGAAYFNGALAYTFSTGAFTPDENMCLLGSGHYVSSRRLAAKISGYRHYKAGVLVRSFRPVRVGTGSTWEGAMMDVLTRKIYRNAGTGAFTYGNDLKYPIPAS